MSRQTMVPLRMGWPTDWAKVFGRPAPLVIEIGFGGADFLLHLARQRPEANVLGLEVSRPSLRKGARKIRRAGLANVRLVHGSALVTLWLLCSPGELESVYVNFPDPWPKPAHQGRRLIDGRFLQLAATRMRGSGELEIATDHSGYAGWIADHLSDSPYFESQLASPYVTEDTGRWPTKYERKALADGRQCFYLKWRRNRQSAPNIFPVPMELPMPHAILKGPLTLDEIARNFKTRSVAADHTHVRFVELYRSQRHQSLVIDSYISEEATDQRVLLAITQRQPGDLLVHLHEVGFPRPTAGIHAAIRCLAEWACTLNPGERLESNNLRSAQKATARAGDR